MLAIQILWIFLLSYLAWRTIVWFKITRGIRLAYIIFLFAGSLALRLALAVKGPGDLHMNTASVFLIGENITSATINYGLNPDAFFLLLFTIFPEGFNTIWVTNLIIGSFIPIVLVLFMNEEKLPRDAVYAGGLLIAIQPLLIRFSTVANRQMFVVFLGLIGLWLLSRYRYRRKTVDLLLGLGALVICQHTRTEASVIILIGCFYLILCGLEERKRLLLWLFYSVFLGLIGLSYYLFSDVFRAQVNMCMQQYIPITVPFLKQDIWLDPEYTSWVMTILFIPGFIIELWNKRARAFLALVSLTLISCVCTHYMVSADMDLGSARYQVLAIPFFIILVSLSFHHIRRWLTGIFNNRLRMIVTSLLAGAVLATSISPMIGVLTPRTVDIEFQFIHSKLPKLPSDAEIYYIYSDFPTDQFEDIGLKPPYYMSYMVGYPNQRWIRWRNKLRSTRRPKFYYHMASCSFSPYMTADFRDKLHYGREIQSQCMAAMRAYGKSPVFEARIPARRHSREVYNRDIIRIGFYRIDQP